MKSVGLTERQFEALRVVKGKFQEDFGKRVTFGEFILILSMGFLEGRNVIDGESEYIVASLRESPEA